jgi:hypothetical protein
LDNVALKDLLGKMVSPAAEWDAVVHLKNEHVMSEQRACHILKACRMTMLLCASG